MSVIYHFSCPQGSMVETCYYICHSLVGDVEDFHKRNPDAVQLTYSPKFSNLLFFMNCKASAFRNKGWEHKPECKMYKQDTAQITGVH